MKIFISYSRTDARDFADKIAETLGDEHSVFTDINKIQVGDIWSNTIDENIDSCDLFLAIVTSASLKSQAVEKEVLRARNRNKKIIPCFYGMASTIQSKWGLGNLQGIEFEDKYELAREIERKIEQNQIKGQQRQDATAQATAEPVKESKQEKVKETEVLMAEETKPDVVKEEIQPRMEEATYFRDDGEIIVKRTEHRSKGRKVASWLIGGYIGYLALGRDKTRKTKDKGILVVTNKALYCAGNVYQYDKVLSITTTRKSLLLTLFKEFDEQVFTSTLELKTDNKNGLFEALEVARIKQIPI